MKISLFFRLFASYVLIIFALSALTIVVLWSSIENHYMSTLKNTLRNSALMARPAVLPLLETNQLGELDKMVSALGKETQTRITVINAEGKVLADSDENARAMENHRNRPEFVEALQGNVGSAKRYSSTANQDMLYVAVPLEQTTKQVAGALRTSFFLRSINSLLADLRQKIVRIALLILFFALVAAAFLSRTFSRPIQELTRAVRKVSAGDFSVRVYPHTGGEIRQLSDSFNAMSDRIAAMVVELTHQKEELDSIIASLQEGLVVLDSQGQIIMVNESFKRLADTNHVASIVEREAPTALPIEGATRAPVIEGRSYWQVLRNAPLIELIQKVREEKTDSTEELELEDRVFICSITYLPLRKETVAVFHDITEIRNVERLKRDFVVNVSHELRTPLTAIKGFTETLEEEAQPEARHYLEIIKRNTDRLINIINDLLLLSQIEEKGMNLEIEKIDLTNLIGNTLKIFEERAANKGLKLSANIDEQLPSITGDAFKLEQVIINLLDNAIKYTEKGEVHIGVHRGDNKAIFLEVRDTGIGIPSEDIPRIFERFYVVDKSRSKKVGGTGLGLSIVKHIVLLHNGEIDVKSTIGMGTTVSVTLPIYPSPKGP
jgi:two-component system, OmpR family, phosphate regulon sensor histidine kinase PhoR